MLLLSKLIQFICRLIRSTTELIKKTCFKNVLFFCTKLKKFCNIKQPHDTPKSQLNIPNPKEEIECYSKAPTGMRVFEGLALCQINKIKVIVMQKERSFARSYCKESRNQHY
uniref:Uncharacterized protein n=1 Tax=Zea mays TaxID=4577 RepID=A0A804P0Z4_MAIZE